MDETVERYAAYKAISKEEAERHLSTALERNDISMSAQDFREGARVGAWEDASWFDKLFNRDKIVNGRIEKKPASKLYDEKMRQSYWARELRDK